MGFSSYFISSCADVSVHSVIESLDLRRKAGNPRLTASRLYFEHGRAGHLLTEDSQNRSLKFYSTFLSSLLMDSLISFIEVL